MAPTNEEGLHNVKAYLLSHPIQSRLAALIQVNTAMRISEPVQARLDDLVLDHFTPHIWMHKNSLTDRNHHPLCDVDGRFLDPNFQACLY
jgi:hypothetical protein